MPVILRNYGANRDYTNPKRYRPVRKALFNNADLLEDSAKKGVGSQRFIDDVTMIATSRITREDDRKFARIGRSRTGRIQLP